jgi:hypothetical protein
MCCHFSCGFKPNNKFLFSLKFKCLCISVLFMEIKIALLLLKHLFRYQQFKLIMQKQQIFKSYSSVVNTIAS